VNNSRFSLGRWREYRASPRGCAIRCVHARIRPRRLPLKDISASASLRGDRASSHSRFQGTWFNRWRRLNRSLAVASDEIQAKSWRVNASVCKRVNGASADLVGRR